MREEMQIALEIKGNKEYTLVNNEIIKDSSISYKAVGIFAYLLSRENTWAFYMSEIEEHTTDKKSSIRSGVKELEDEGYIKRVRTMIDNKSTYKWYLYPLKQRKSENQTFENQTLVSKEVIYNNNTSNITSSNTSIYSFDQFWDDYGVKKSKKACERKYKKISEKKRKAIKDALPAYIQETSDVRFRKHPATYLNNESWEDEPIIEATKTLHKEDNTNNLMPKEYEHLKALVVDGTVSRADGDYMKRKGVLTGYALESF